METGWVLVVLLTAAIVLYVLWRSMMKTQVKQVVPVTRSAKTKSRRTEREYYDDEDDLLLSGAVLVGTLDADGAKAHRGGCTIETDYYEVESSGGCSDGGDD